MKSSEVLRAALALLDGGKAWVQKPDVPYHIQAKRCALMAISRAKRDSYHETAERYLKLACGSRGAGDVAIWNDAPGRTWPEIEAGFLKAISLAESAND